MNDEFANCIGCFSFKKDSTHQHKGEVEVDGIGKMEIVIMESISTETAVDNFRFKVILRNSFTRFILCIEETLINHNNDSKNNSVVKLDPKTLLKIVKSALLEKVDETVFKPKFTLYSENVRYEVKKGSSRSKRRKVQTLDFLNEKLSLVLTIQCNPQPSIYFNPIKVKLKFQNLPKVDISPLPNELLIEVFQFLDSKLLFHSVCFVTHRFHQLIESEYMYKTHHFHCLNEHVSEIIRNNGESWKEYTIREWNNDIHWENRMVSYEGRNVNALLSPDFNKFKEEREKCLEFHRNRKIVIINQLNVKGMGISYVVTSRFFRIREKKDKISEKQLTEKVLQSAVGSGEDRSTLVANSVRWKVRMRREFLTGETYWKKYWIGLLSRDRESGFFFDLRDGDFSFSNRVKRLPNTKSFISKFDSKGNITLEVVLLKSGLLRFECEDIINEMTIGSRHGFRRKIGGGDIFKEYCLSGYADHRSKVTEIEIISMTIN